MVTVRGRDAVDRFFAQLPKEIEGKLLRGAGRAGGAVLVEAAKEGADSKDLREGIYARQSSRDGRIVVKVTVRPGWAYSLGVWQEWGTEPHFIKVAEDQRQGRSIGRINRLVKAGSLVINGQFVGDTVRHPGAVDKPFLRPALDIRGADAVRAAQAYINSRIVGGRIVGSVEPEEEQ
ncbi:HK97 gp10 family phage protein [Sphingomonas sp. ABOLE]|uniref:HK97 gp10 family phage protein n=1 Tax=Sphingomonas sp. ABOLE TaxID=1985878 RepID=UPI000F7EA89E|nr:HK97 gp10 family phage protein [Sphingomonas sp. ABOLE]RSV41533.1 HK97 gp10 family phage protein [Sphingomonas sp. ABOLE]